MSAEQFANCYVDRVGGDVERVIEYAETIGAAGFAKIAAIASGAAASWFLRVSGIAQAVEAIAATLFTVEAAQALVLMAGAASWAALIDGVVHCYHLM